MADHLFVYGTLMKATGHPMAAELAARARYAGPATFQGRLYRLAHYPAAVAAEAPAEQVHGELYELADADTLLAALDAYEGCLPGDPAPHEYVRAQCSVVSGGTQIKAWIYLYNQPTEQLEQIKSGRFTAPE